jgi:hypothetical protein
MVIVISDLLDEPEPAIKGLKHLRFRGTDVLVFQVLDPQELTFPFRGAARFRDVESAEELVADPSKIRKQYLRELAGLTLRYDRELRGAGIDYVQLDTSQPLDFALLSYLSARARRKLGRFANRPCRDAKRTMNFLYPAFLIGAVLVAIPIVLHLLRRDVAPPVPFTAVRLLRASPIERSRRRRLRDVLLLAARVTAILLLAGAFARPYFAADGASGALAIVAVDRSFSMGAPGTFARALDLARAAIDEAGSGARVAVIAFDDRPAVVAGPSSAGDARAALNDLRPGFGATRYAPMLMKAAEVADGDAATLTVVTDLQRAGWEDQARGLLPQGIDLRVADAGAPAENPRSPGRASRRTGSSRQSAMRPQPSAPANSAPSATAGSSRPPGSRYLRAAPSRCRWPSARPPPAR